MVSMTVEFKEQMEEQLNSIGIVLTTEQLQQFYKYYEILIEWNEKINLTAITQMDEVVTKHFVDSLALIKVVENLSEKENKIIDVGTGAGFPGIPLIIAYPKLKITLLDSLNKRVKFLEEVIAALELTNIEAIHGRAEDLGHQNVSRETYDICVSRAVANISTLSEYCMPFVKVGGYFISYKSGKVEEELSAGKGAIKKLNGSIEKVISFKLPNTDERSFIKIKKEGKLNKIYPRKAGLPSKEPLK